MLALCVTNCSNNKLISAYRIKMKLATIEIINDVYPHPDAERLDIVKVLGYQLVTQKGLHEKGKKIIYVRPDTVLSKDQKWSEGYLDYAPTRVKAIKLRKEWSEGIIVTFEQVSDIWVEIKQDEKVYADKFLSKLDIGEEVSGIIGVTKYEPPMPQDENAAGYLPYQIPETDEERWENLVGTDQLPLGEVVDIFLKIDGTSMTQVALKHADQPEIEDTGYMIHTCGRRLSYKLESDNMYIQADRKNQISNKMITFMSEKGIKGLAFRGELYGQGIQVSGRNPFSQKPKGFAMFSVYNLDTRAYARKGDSLYSYELAKRLSIEHVPVVEKDVVLTQELIDYYSTGIKTLNNQPFEGVIVQHSKGSFKIINKEYDSRK